MLSLTSKKTVQHNNTIFTPVLPKAPGSAVLAPTHHVNELASQPWWTVLNCFFFLNVSYNTNIVPNVSQTEDTITLSTFTPVKNWPMNRHFRSPLSKQNASCMVDLCGLIDKMVTLIPEVSHGGPMLCWRVRPSVLAVIVCEKQVSDASMAQ